MSLEAALTRCSPTGQLQEASFTYAGWGPWPSFAQDCVVLDFATHSDLTGRLRGLVILLGDRLTPEQAHGADAYIDASEFGVALETLADWLSEDATPIPDDIRRDFERLSAQIGIVERVMRPLGLCPAEADV